MSAPTTVQLRSDLEVTFRGITLRGALLHVPEGHLLVLASEEDEEVLTTEAPESGLARAKACIVNDLLPQQVVTITDYSERAELSDALIDAGVIRVLSMYPTGPWASSVIVAEVL